MVISNGWAWENIDTGKLDGLPRPKELLGDPPDRSIQTACMIFRIPPVMWYRKDMFACGPSCKFKRTIEEGSCVLGLNEHIYPGKGCLAWNGVPTAYKKDPKGQEKI